jgi:hypothetical protein
MDFQQEKLKISRNLVFTLFMGLDQRLWLIFNFSC